MTDRIARLLRRDAAGTIATISIVAVLAAGGALALGVTEAALQPTLRGDPEHRLMAIWRTSRGDPAAGRGWLSYPDIVDLATRQRAFVELAAWRTQPRLTHANDRS